MKRWAIAIHRFGFDFGLGSRRHCHHRHTPVRMMRIVRSTLTDSTQLAVDCSFHDLQNYLGQGMSLYEHSKAVAAAAPAVVAAAAPAP